MTKIEYTVEVGGYAAATHLQFGFRLDRVVTKEEADTIQAAIACLVKIAETEVSEEASDGE